MDGDFDVVVATNAIHAVRDIDAALRHVRSLLAPGGCFILCEVTEHLSWFDISTGLIEGWQAFEDRWRTDQPLLCRTLGGGASIGGLRRANGCMA